MARDPRMNASLAACCLVLRGRASYLEDRLESTLTPLGRTAMRVFRRELIVSRYLLEMLDNADVSPASFARRWPMGDVE